VLLVTKHKAPKRPFSAPSTTLALRIAPLLSEDAFEVLGAELRAKLGGSWATHLASVDALGRSAHIERFDAQDVIDLADLLDVEASDLTLEEILEEVRTALTPDSLDEYEDALDAISSYGSEDGPFFGLDETPHEEAFSTITWAMEESGADDADLDDATRKGSQLMAAVLEHVTDEDAHAHLTVLASVNDEVSVSSLATPVEDPAETLPASAAFTAMFLGDGGSIILRRVKKAKHPTFDVPLVEVTGWEVKGYDVIGLSAADVFSALGTDFESGDPLTPELGVECVAAPDLDFP
jgi:hypothetical protein